MDREEPLGSRTLGGDIRDTGVERGKPVNHPPHLRLGVSLGRFSPCSFWRSQIRFVSAVAMTTVRSIGSSRLVGGISKGFYILLAFLKAPP